MVTSVIELADKLYKAFKEGKLPNGQGRSVVDRYYALALSRVCANANDIGLPLSVVEQLLKDTGYEQLLP